MQLIVLLLSSLMTMSLQCCFDDAVSCFQQYVNSCLFVSLILAFFNRNLPLRFFRAFKAKAYAFVKANKTIAIERTLLIRTLIINTHSYVRVFWTVDLTEK